MGIFFNRGKRKQGTSIEITVQCRSSEVDMKKIEQGYIEHDDKLYKPGTVFVSSERSSVYHASPYCGNGICISNNPIPLTEKQAKRRGLHMCSRCNW